MDALRASRVREVVVAARRGPAQSAFTLPELIGLTTTAEVVIGAADRALARRALDADPGDDPDVAADAQRRKKLEILAALPLAEDPSPRLRPRIRLAYHLIPRKVLGADRVRAVEFAGPHVLPAGLVLAAVGHRGRPLPGLPFDEHAAVVPNRAGRVIDPATGTPVRGAYVAGWIKRGPSGFIGTNKSCAMQTVTALVDDVNAGLLPDLARTGALDRLVRARQPDLIDGLGWRAIDDAEIVRGRLADRPRVKFTSYRELLAAALGPA